jgi:hypothetical protein
VKRKDARKELLLVMQSVNIDVIMMELNCVKENDDVTTQNVEMWSGMGEGANQKSRTTRILMELTM